MVECLYIKKNGERCKAKALRNSKYCFYHSRDKDTIKTRKEAQRRGGRNNGRTYEPATEEISVKSMVDVVSLMENTINDVRMHRMDIRRANSIGFLVNIVVKAIEKKDLERRLGLLEKVVLKNKGGA